MVASPSLDTLVDDYLRDDPDEDDCATLRAWRDAGNRETLEAAFASNIAFGTAGLRATVAPGPANMNARNVRRATRALLEVLTDRVPDARERGVVVGFDARPSSARFAHDVRALAGEAGFVVHGFRDAVPTPLVAFAASELRAAAAVVITASHNPPADNGMKVYGPDGALVIAPWDREIASRMDDARPTPRTERGDSNQGNVRWFDDAILDHYVARCVALSDRDVPRAGIRIAYTALHGVGESVVRRALTKLGDVELRSVATQAAPDGTFPTTPKPNPEEPGALDRVLALARAMDASLALANDPDADRLAVAVRHEGDWIVLHGDELGVGLGDHMLQTTDVANPLVLSTIVSSPWLAEIARSRGHRAEITLTGHKWIHARRAELERTGAHFVFGYEEALGYAFDHGVRDKDGIAAAVVVARIASELAASGLTLVDRLESIARDHGMHRSRSFSIPTGTSDERETLRIASSRLLDAATKTLASHPIVRRIDGKTSLIRASDGTDSALGLPSSSLVGAELENGVRVLVRPSGTEPKTKVYLDLRTSLVPGERYLAARRRCDAALATIERDVRAYLTP